MHGVRYRCVGFVTSPSSRDTCKGFTLLELIVVILIIGVISTLAASKLESVAGWKQKSEIRAFANLWEFLYAESLARRESYRLSLDLDNGSYFVRREVSLDRDSIKQVDYLKNLRTRGEQRRRRESENQNLLSLDDELRADEDRRSIPLEVSYYAALFSDPNEEKRLAIPVEFPSLAQNKVFPQGLRVRDVRTETGHFERGDIVFNFSPNKMSPSALIHFAVDNSNVYSVYLNPEWALRILYQQMLTFSLQAHEQLEMNNNKRRIDGQGFTLIEIAVAVAVLGIGLTTLLSLHSRYIRNYLREDSETRAALYAHYILTMIELSGTPPDEGREEHDLLNGLKEIGYFGENAVPESDRLAIKQWRYLREVTSIEVAPLENVLRRIQVTIAWGEGPDETFALVHFMRLQEKKDSGST
jgi:prepilin-type N-terminal cleavage/methylation domain-containing protein